MPAAQPDWILTARRELGRRIAAARMDADLTQERLAERAGIDRSTVQRIEGGHGDPKLSHLLLIARAVGRPLHDLLP